MLCRIIRVTHRNVIKDGFDLEEFNESKADAVFLDLPQPYDAIKFLKSVLKVNGKLCSFSPCIEQITKTANQLANHGFFNIRMKETLQRDFERKYRNIKDPLREKDSKIQKEISFFRGKKFDKGHTGYLLFATYIHPK